MLEILPFIVFHYKQLFNQSVLTHWLAIETVFKLLDRGRKIKKMTFLSIHIIANQILYNDDKST